MIKSKEKRCIVCSVVLTGKGMSSVCSQSCRFVSFHIYYDHNGVSLTKKGKEEARKLGINVRLQ